MNLQNFNVTNLHHAFDTIDSLCKNMGRKTKGSELVGLVPLKAMLDAGYWYAGEGLSDEEYIAIAIERLGLNSIGEFNPHNRIIELALREEKV